VGAVSLVLEPDHLPNGGARLVKDAAVAGEWKIDSVALVQDGSYLVDLCKFIALQYLQL